MNSKENLDLYLGAYKKDFKFNDENLSMLSWYVNRILDSIRDMHSLRILSLGIGHKIVSENLIHRIKNEKGSEYIIIEGSSGMIEQFKNSRKSSFRLNSILPSFHTGWEFGDRYARSRGFELP